MTNKFRIKETKDNRFQIQEKFLWMWWDYRFFEGGKLKNNFKKYRKASKYLEKFKNKNKL